MKMLARLTFLLFAAAALGGCWTHTYCLADGFSLEVDKHAVFAPEIPLGTALFALNPLYLFVTPPGYAEFDASRLKHDEVLIAVGEGESGSSGALNSTFTSEGRQFATDHHWQIIDDNKRGWRVVIGEAPLSEPVVQRDFRSFKAARIGGWLLYLTPRVRLAGGKPDRALFAMTIARGYYWRVADFDSRHWAVQDVGPIQSFPVGNWAHWHCTIRLRKTSSGEVAKICVCCDLVDNVRAWLCSVDAPFPECREPWERELDSHSENGRLQTRPARAISSAPTNESSGLSSLPPQRQKHKGTQHDRH